MLGKVTLHFVAFPFSDLRTPIFDIYFCFSLMISALFPPFFLHFDFQTTFSKK